MVPGTLIVIQPYWHSGLRLLEILVKRKNVLFALEIFWNVKCVTVFSMLRKKTFSYDTVASSKFYILSIKYLLRICVIFVYVRESVMVYWCLRKQNKIKQNKTIQNRTEQNR